MSDKFQVMAERCDQCLFSPNRIVDSKRMADVLAECKETDSHFVCHKATIKAMGPVCCRGYFDEIPAPATIVQLAKRFEAVGMDVVEYVEVPDATA